jgi:hypothetical protein
MKEICCLYAASEGGHMNLIDDMPSRRLSTVLSQDDILYVQERFITNGLHHIVVQDIEHGRTLMEKLLKSMHYFQNVSCLAQSYPIAIDYEQSNLLENIQYYCGHDIEADLIEEYFLECYMADFLWVELTETLLRNPLALQIVYSMHTLDIAHNIPVIAISYA